MTGLRALTVLLLTPFLALPAAAQSHLVVITGAGGEARYEDTFHEWASRMVDGAKERYDLPAENVAYLGEDPERDPERITDRSSRENVERVLRDLAGQTGEDDVVFIMLIGHGSYDGNEGRFNLPGRDLAATEYAALLDDVTASVVFVNTASASGAFLEPLAAPGRTVITATRSGREANATVFGEYFVEAYAGDGADTDMNSRISLLEAFHYAQREVERYYADQNRLPTERALLDDVGEGQGTPEPDPEGEIGALASTIFLRGAAAPSDPRLADDPELQALYEEKARIEGELDALRRRRDTMEPERYDAELEELLVELALTEQAIREIEEGGEDETQAARTIRGAGVNGAAARISAGAQ